MEAVRDPPAVLQWAVVSHQLEPSKAHVPVWDPASKNLASNHMGPEPQVVPASSLHTHWRNVWEGSTGAIIGLRRVADIMASHLEKGCWKCELWAGGSHPGIRCGSHPAMLPEPVDWSLLTSPFTGSHCSPSRASPGALGDWHVVCSHQGSLAQQPDPPATDQWTKG